MLRILAFATLAVTALAAGSLSPAPAEAKGWKHHHHGHHHHQGHWHHRHWHAPAYAFGGPVLYVEPGCYVNRLVPTRHGLRWRAVNRCH